MGERRRRTMGERGAPPDPLNSGLYCRHCASKYCSCDGNGHADEYWNDYYADDPAKDHTGHWSTEDSGNHRGAADNAEAPPEESEDSEGYGEAADNAQTPPEESEGWTVTDTVVVGAMVVGTGALVALAGPLIGIGASVSAFVGGHLVRRLFEE